MNIDKNSHKLKRSEHQRLARECENLDPRFEQELAEKGLKEDKEQWPEF